MNAMIIINLLLSFALGFCLGTILVLVAASRAQEARELERYAEFMQLLKSFV